MPACRAGRLARIALQIKEKNIKKIGALVWFWTPAIVWMAVIFSFSSIEGPKIPPLGSNIDKLFHLVEYFILGALLVRAFSKTSINPNHIYIFIFSILIASIFGATDEFHQRFVPGRSCTLFDLLFDMIGSSLGAALYAYKERGLNALDKSV